MIYTIVPVEQLLFDITKAETADPQRRVIHAKYMGEQVLLSRNDTGEYSIERLISTNPGSFLKKEFNPGSTADDGKIKLL